MLQIVCLLQRLGMTPQQNNIMRSEHMAANTYMPEQIPLLSLGVALDSDSNSIMNPKAVLSKHVANAFGLELVVTSMKIKCIC